MDSHWPAVLCVQKRRLLANTVLACSGLFWLTQQTQPYPQSQSTLRAVPWLLLRIRISQTTVRF